MVKRIVAISLGMVIGITILFYFSYMSVANHFVRYLWWQFTSAVPSSSDTVNSAGTTIHYTVYGQGEPILMLHGGLSNKLSWFSQLPELSSSGYRLILLDSRGHGLSGLGSATLDYRLMVADARAVLDRLKIKHTDVIGWSDGANSALLMASLYPERIGRIVAISGNYSPEGLTPEARQENNERTTGIKYWLYRWWTGAGEKFQELERRLKHLWSSGPILSAEDLEKISSPVLIIIGEHDLISVNHATAMARLLPNSRLLIIKNGGHSTLITHAEDVNSQIRDFLAGGGPEANNLSL